MIWVILEAVKTNCVWLIWCEVLTQFSQLQSHKMLHLPVLPNFFVSFSPSCPTDKMRAFDNSCIGVYQLQRIKITQIKNLRPPTQCIHDKETVNSTHSMYTSKATAYRQTVCTLLTLAELTSWRFSSASSAAFSSWRAAIRDRLFWCRELYTWLRWLRQRDCSTNRVELSLKIRINHIIVHQKIVFARCFMHKK